MFSAAKDNSQKITHSKNKKGCAQLKKLLFLTFLIIFLTFNSQIVANAEQGYEESPLNTKETYDNFMISLLSEKLTESMNEHYGKSLVGYKRTSENFIKIQQFIKENTEERSMRNIKYVVTFSLSPVIEEKGKQVTEGTDIIQFEVLTDYLDEGDTDKGVKLIKYQQHK
ncbi:hypothetical protein Q8G31_24685 [Priestia megaterium]|jgi:hypothetical protein|nr:hypothetical protein [Priestia megaterium]